MSILNHFFDYKPEVLALDEKAMEMCQPYFRQMEEIRDFNQLKMLKAFADTQMSSTDMLGTTGYGLWDTGRAKLEQIFAQVMGAEDALVRSQFQSGTHTLAVALFGLLLEEGMNIKVCLLPDGEDPDSFARKHNATEFQKFIQDNETDFIRFKTNLLLEDAGKDPIKRAELIGNLVQSISIIPEAIVRDVYIKECSQLLRIEDKLLVSEVAKRRETQAEKQAEQRNRETRKNNAARDAAQAPLPDGMQPPYPEDMPPYPMDGEMPDGGAPLPPEAAEYVSYIPQEGKEGQEFYKYERLILQMVVRYGEKILCNVPDEEGKEIPITVTEYIVNDLKEDELAFHNPLHRQMLTEAAEHIHNEGFTAERYFLAHPDPIISKLSTELIADRYQLSKYHSKAQRLVTDEERLFELVPTLMINFKFAIISEEMKHMMYALQDPAVANDEEQCTSIMKRYSELREIKSIMAKRLGDRVVLG